VVSVSSSVRTTEEVFTCLSSHGNAEQVFRLLRRGSNLLRGELPTPHIIQFVSKWICHRNRTDSRREDEDMPRDTEKKDFSRADEVRNFPKGKVELITIGGATIGRATLEPGWRWSKSVQPIAKTKSCEAPHFQYHVAGTLKVVMDDGTELVCKPAMCRSCRPGTMPGCRKRECRDRRFPGMVDYAKKAA